MPLLGRRKIPEIGEIPTTTESFESRTYKLKLVTPMFGGGAVAGQIDRQRPIRASSIRGHLRWWWRLLNRHRFVENEVLNAAKMRDRESEIWGSTETPSPVILRVKVGQIHMNHYRLKREPDAFGFRQFTPESYALFSAIEKDDPPVESLLKEGFEFELSLRWPTAARLNELRRIENKQLRREGKLEKSESVSDITNEIEQTLSAWIAWGGIGARTRRGLGAMELVSADKPLPDEVVPPGCQLFTIRPNNAADKPMDEWRNAVDVYQRFRQSFRGGRHKKNGRDVPGRSHWPEPDSIRDITGCALTSPTGPSAGDADQDCHDHTRQLTTQTQPNFPRAVLGLPIVFHFSDGPGKGNPANRTKDPAGVELKPRAKNADGSLKSDDHGRPESADRMGSPIITKPVKLKDQWHAGVLILPHQHALNMHCVLVGKKSKWDTSKPPGREPQDCHEAIPNSQIVGPQLSSLCPPPMTDPLRGHQNAISAFISFLGATTDGGVIEGPKRVFTEWRPR